MTTWEFHPLTPERWEDFERLFGPSGAYGGCWCMWWRSTRGEFETRGNRGNRAAMQSLVDGGTVPGILAYKDDQPAGWCSVAPRQDYGSLNRSRVLKPIDDTPVWSIVCFYVSKEHRGGGMLLRLVKAAVAYAAEHGAQVVEAYPTLPRQGRLSPVSSFMGLPAVFEQAGFKRVAQPSQSKVILRYSIAGD